MHTLPHSQLRAALLHRRRSMAPPNYSTTLQPTTLIVSVRTSSAAPAALPTNIRERAKGPASRRFNPLLEHKLRLLIHLRGTPHPQNKHYLAPNWTILCGTPAADPPTSYLPLFGIFIHFNLNTITLEPSILPNS